MDSVTHIVLGACIGEVILGKKLGKRAMLWGAIAQSIPDIDVVSALWTDTAGSLLSHRGLTHSIFFAILASVSFPFVAWRLHKKHDISYARWVLFFGIELACHLFLDVFNSYGTGLLEPFSHARFSLNAVFVVDPLFTIWPLIAVALVLILKNNRKYYAGAAIGLSGLYLLVCVLNKAVVQQSVLSSLARQRIVYGRRLITPSPMNNLLWYVVAESRDGFYTGYRSVFDKEETMALHFFPRNDSLLTPFHNDEKLQKLIRFSQDFYTAEKWRGHVVFNDLRFGQIAGWQDPSAPFVFHFFINAPDNNDLVLQRGRFAGWNRQTFHSLIERIKGE